MSKPQRPKPQLDTNVTFHAYAAYGPDEPLRPFDYNPKPLGPTDVEVKILCCGICGTDCHTIKSEHGPTRYPCVVGHEIIGTVVAKGVEVRELDLGARVGIGAQVDACRNRPERRRPANKDCEECVGGLEEYCSRNISTYNARDFEGYITYGGYADRVRAPAAFCVPVPSALESSVAAPLLCAGSTVYSPLREFGAGPAKSVGVVGVGGLGHLAVQFAAKTFKARTVVAVSHSERKREDALAMGATKFLNSSNRSEMKEAFGTLDLLIITANPKGLDLHPYLRLLRMDGVACMVAAPEGALQVIPFFLMRRRIRLVGSLIAGVDTISEMLRAAARDQVHPVIERFPMSQCNDGVDRVFEGTARYRVVLENQGGPGKL
eukprot:Clim_evm14s1 gene=Clim_evmTU14s1